MRDRANARALAAPERRAPKLPRIDTSRTCRACGCRAVDDDGRCARCGWTRERSDDQHEAAIAQCESCGRIDALVHRSGLQVCRACCAIEDHSASKRGFAAANTREEEGRAPSAASKQASLAGPGGSRAGAVSLAPSHDVGSGRAFARSAWVRAIRAQSAPEGRLGGAQ